MTVKTEDIKIGVKFKNPTGTIFIVDKIENTKEYGKLIRASLEDGRKGNYCDKLADFVLIMNEEKAIKI